MVLSLCLLVITFFIISICFYRWYLSKLTREHICILVLGDIGRSPRMQYHAVCFAMQGFTVDIVGYPGTPPIEDIRNNKRIRVHYLQPPPDLKNKLPLLLCYILKVLWQAADLLQILFCKKLTTSLLVQNPPAIPTLPISWFYCFITRTRFVIDWHNYAHSLMELKLGNEHILVGLAKFIETAFGNRAELNFCVTQSMQTDLRDNLHIKANVMYDKPWDQFRPITLKQKHELLMKLANDYNCFKGTNNKSTVMTEMISQDIYKFKPERPGLIVSSTSWTEDEDFSVLLNALQEYENIRKKKMLNLPDLICVITGKGPLKDFYVTIIELKNWQHVTIITPWLELDDYAKLLGTADLGVSLHMSSSGLDLPMKVVDMFGCCLPVCAYYFQCLSELVKHGKNSWIFSCDADLAKQLMLWFENFPNDEQQQGLNLRFRDELMKYQSTRWYSHWVINVWPHFKE